MIARVKQLPTIKTKRGKLMSEYPLTKKHTNTAKKERETYLSMLQNKKGTSNLKEKERESHF